MKLLRSLTVLGLATVLVASAMADSADARRRRRTRRARSRRTSNVAQTIDFNLFDTGRVSDFSYTGDRGSLQGFGGSLLTLGSSAPDVDSSDSGGLTIGFLVEDVIDDIDIQLEYEFSDIFSVVPELEDDSSVQNIIDFLAVGNVNGFDIFDDISEGFEQINSRSLLGEQDSTRTGSIFSSFLRFGRAETDSQGVVTSFETLENADQSTKDKIIDLNSAYADLNGDNKNNTLFIDGEPLNTFGNGDDDLILAFGDELEDVPEPGTLAGLFLLMSTGLGRALFLRKRQA